MNVFRTSSWIVPARWNQAGDAAQGSPGGRRSPDSWVGTKIDVISQAGLASSCSGAHVAHGAHGSRARREDVFLLLPCSPVVDDACTCNAIPVGGVKRGGASPRLRALRERRAALVMGDRRRSGGVLVERQGRAALHTPSHAPQVLRVDGFSILDWSENCGDWAKHARCRWVADANACLTSVVVVDVATLDLAPKSPPFPSWPPNLSFFPHQQQMAQRQDITSSTLPK